MCLQIAKEAIVLELKMVKLALLKHTWEHHSKVDSIIYTYLIVGVLRCLCLI